MATSRRSFLAATLGAAALPASSGPTKAASRRPSGELARRIVREFNQLPGRKALKISVAGSLALPDDIRLLMPLGVSAFLKGGNLDFRHEHALSLAGGAFIPEHRWVYYSFLINWVDDEGGTTSEVRPSPSGWSETSSDGSRTPSVRVASVSTHRGEQGMGSIARAALRYVPTDGAIIVDAGSPTAQLAELFRGRPPLSVLTNALPIAMALAGKPGLVVHTVGGRIRPSSLAEVDAVALRTLAEVSVDVAFMATSGVSEGHGFSTPDPAEAAIKRAMIRAAKRVIVLSDHSKIGRDHFARFADLAHVHLLITDADADPVAIRRLESLGLAVEIAGASDARADGSPAAPVRRAGRP